MPFPIEDRETQRLLLEVAEVPLPKPDPSLLNQVIRQDRARFDDSPIFEEQVWRERNPELPSKNRLQAIEREMEYNSLLNGSELDERPDLTFPKAINASETPITKGDYTPNVVEQGYLKIFSAMESVGIGGKALKLYNDIVQRGRTESISERDFDEGELAQLKHIITQASGNKTEGAIVRKDYLGNDGSNILDSFSNILGRFRYKKEEDGTIVVTDTYDFNAVPEIAIEENPVVQAAFGLLNPIGLAAHIGRRTTGEGKGLPVEIRIPPTIDPDKRPRSVIEQLTGLDGKERYQLWPEKLAREGLEALRKAAGTFSDVLDGKVAPDSDEGLKAVTDLAMTFGMGGLATAPVRTGLGVFGGRMSPRAVATAEAYEREGISDDTIKLVTGLERGKDGFWRKEIDDSEFDITYNGLRTGTTKGVDGQSVDVEWGFLGDLVRHTKLFEDYPEARKLKVAFIKEEDLDNTVMTSKNSGLYIPDKGGVILVAANQSEKERKRTLLHEIQHWIQDIEGFAINSPDDFTKEIEDMVKGTVIRKYEKPALDLIKALLDEGMEDQARKIAKQILNRNDNALYRHLASEVEARNVEHRMSMSAEERRNLIGRRSEDFPRDEQIWMLNESD